jgi:effector-binding domain-containing protein
MTIRLEQQSAVPLAVARRRCGRQELGKVVPEACGFVWNALRSQNVTDAGRHVAVYLDGAINVEIGVELERPYVGDDRLQASATPAGRVATMTHLGPYGGLGLAHEAIQKWCLAQGRVLAGPSWEIYGHWQDDWNQHPERIRTDVFYLLE